MSESETTQSEGLGLIQYEPPEKLTMAICGASEKSGWKRIDPEKLDEYSNKLNVVIGELVDKEILEARQGKILTDNFGLSGEPSKTAVKIAEGLGVTTERVVNLRKNALLRLRHYPLMRDLINEYYDGILDK